MLVEGEETTGLGSVAVGSEVEASAEAMMNDEYIDYCILLFDVVVVSLKNRVLVCVG